MAWDGQLDEDTVDCGVIVGSGDLLDELQLGAGFGDIDQGADNVGLVTVSTGPSYEYSQTGSPTSCAAFNFMRT